ncbi:MAG: glutaredoxin family protein [Steroidobacteraceae bacterium]
MADQLQLYWQPGCTSCLRTREFLMENGVDFESINVRSDGAALRSLAARGLRSVPVLLRGEHYVLAQDLDEVARFVGVALERPRLDAATLLHRLADLLAAAERLTYQLPLDRIGEKLPQRERTWLDLAYHIPMIVEGFLAAVRGGVLTYQHYELTPPTSVRTPAEVAVVTAHLHIQLQRWAQSTVTDSGLADRRLNTYFGEKPLQVVLERTTWHVAQHCRQLAELVGRQATVSSAAALPVALLAGLPLPTAIWDPEITDAR